MDYEITRGGPDGIRVRAEFYVDTWEDLAELMRRLQVVDAEV